MSGRILCLWLHVLVCDEQGEEQALAPQGTIALLSQTSHGKWQLQEMFDLLCKVGQLPQEELSDVCLSPEVHTDGGSCH